MKTSSFNVSMSCGHCQKRIEDNIKSAEGVKSLNVDLANKKVNIEFDDAKTSEAKLQSAIENLGFTVSK